MIHSVRVPCQHAVELSFRPTAMSVFTRHPRYVCLLVFILLVCSFLLLPSHSSPLPRATNFSFKTTRHILREEDARYSQALEAREDLVRKWGPTAEDVVACVAS